MRFDSLLLVAVWLVGEADGRADCSDQVSLCRIGWNHCWDARVGATVRKNCPRMCGLCTPARRRSHRRGGGSHRNPHGSGGHAHGSSSNGGHGAGANGHRHGTNTHGYGHGNGAHSNGHGPRGHGSNGKGSKGHEGSSGRGHESNGHGRGSHSNGHGSNSHRHGSNTKNGHGSNSHRHGSNTNSHGSNSQHSASNWKPGFCRNHPKCTEWKASGFCSRYDAQVTFNYCPEACGFCAQLRQKPPVCPPVVQPPPPPPVQPPPAPPVQPPAPVVDTRPANERFLFAVDPKVEPCEDFFQHVCGRWQQLHPLRMDESERSWAGEGREHNDEQMKALLTELKPSNAEERELQRFYSLCNDEKALRGVGVAPIVDRIEEFGGWPLLGKLKAVDWDESKFDLGALLAQINTAVGLQSFLTITTDRRELLDKKLSIFIYDDLGMPAEDFVKPAAVTAYWHFGFELVALLAQDAQSPRTLKEIRADYLEVDNFAHKLAAIVQKHAKKDVLGWPFTSKLAAEFQPTLRSISQDPTFDAWLTAHPDVWLVQEIIADFHKAIDDQLAKDKKVVVNFVLLRYLQQMAPFLDRRFTDAVQRFKDRRTGTNTAKTRTMYCIDAARRFYPDLTDSLYIQKYLPAGTRTEVEGYIQGIRQELIDFWASVKWMTADDKKEAVEKVRNLKIAFAQPFPRSQFDPITDFDKKNFPQFIEALIRLRQTQEFRAVEKDEKRNQFIQRRQSIAESDYNGSYNLLYIPAAYVQKELYYPADTETPAINYGTLGASLGFVMGETLDDNWSLTDSKLQDRDWWSAPTKKQYATESKCLIDAFSTAVIPEVPGKKMNGGKWFETNARVDLGIKVAFEAYKKITPPNPPTVPGFKYTPEQAFFVSFVTKSCNVQTVAKLKAVLDNSELPAREQNNLLLANNPAFSQAFQCPAGAKMNAAKKCDFY